MNTFEKLERLTELAKKDEILRKALLKTRENKEPHFARWRGKRAWSFTPASFWLWARNTPTTSARAQTAATLRRMTLLTMPMRFS